MGSLGGDYVAADGSARPLGVEVGLACDDVAAAYERAVAAGATLVLRRGSTRRGLPLEDFFIAYGKQDRSPDEIVEAVKKSGVPVEYVVFPDEGHGFAKKKNQIEANRRILEFLDKYLAPTVSK